jgi:hypothetical protein
MSEQTETDRVVKSLVDTVASLHSSYVERVTREQLAMALTQAISCGDFMRLVEPSGGGQQVAYLPYRREQELKKRIATLEGETFDLSEELLRAKTRIATLEAGFQQSQEARTGWLNEFDGYKLKILELTQRLSEARHLIQLLNDGRDDGMLKRSVKLWLEKTP